MAILEFAQGPIEKPVSLVPAPDLADFGQFIIDTSLSTPINSRVILLTFEYFRVSGGTGAATEVVFEIEGSAGGDAPFSNLKTGTDAGGIMTLGPVGATNQVVCPVLGTETFSVRLDNILFSKVGIKPSLTNGNADDLLSIWYRVST